MSRCRRSEGATAPSGFQVETDLRTRRLVTFVPASPPAGGFSVPPPPSPALKHHGGFDDPACKKIKSEIL